MAAVIHNAGTSATALPFPFRGMLKAGERVAVSGSVADVVAELGPSLGQLRVYEDPQATAEAFRSGTGTSRELVSQVNGAGLLAPLAPDFTTPGYDPASTGSYTSGAFTYASTIDSVLTKLSASYAYDNGRAAVVGARGKMPMIVFFHGYNQASANISDAVMLLAARMGFFAVRIDLRGRGSAASMSGPPTDVDFDGGAHTITRNTGSFVTDGFVVGWSDRSGLTASRANLYVTDTAVSHAEVNTAGTDTAATDNVALGTTNKNVVICEKVGAALYVKVNDRAQQTQASVGGTFTTDEMTVGHVKQSGATVFASNVEIDLVCRVPSGLSTLQRATILSLARQDLGTV